MSNIIEIRDLSQVYSPNTPFEKVALSDINLNVEDGNIIGIIGHTGSGKSTLIQHLNGLLKPTTGEIIVDGKKMWTKDNDIRQFRFLVGLVFQYPEYQLFEETVYKDISFGPKNKGLNDEELDNAVKNACEFVGITPDMFEKSPFDLSGGQKRRVAIAGVLAMDPKVLILDEPTSGLDPKGRDMILSQIKEYQQATKKTVIIVSHSMEDVAVFANKTLVMNKGHIWKYDDTKEIFSHHSELAEIGLNVPSVTRIFAGLKSRGHTLPEVITVDEAYSAIISRLEKGEKK